MTSGNKIQKNRGSISGAKSKKLIKSNLLLDFLNGHETICGSLQVCRLFIFWTHFTNLKRLFVIDGIMMVY